MRATDNESCALRINGLIKRAPGRVLIHKRRASLDGLKRFVQRPNSGNLVHVFILSRSGNESRANASLRRYTFFD